MTPKTVEELVELMAGPAIRDRYEPDWVDHYMRTALHNLDKAGLAVCPKEATEEMVHAALNTTWQGTDTYTRHQIKAAIAAGSIRVKK